MSVADVISLLGGIALFLFGMSLMGEGLKKVAGSRLELVLYKLSSTPLKGVLLGTGVTAVCDGKPVRCGSFAQILLWGRGSRAILAAGQPQYFDS